MAISASVMPSLTSVRTTAAVWPAQPRSVRLSRGRVERLMRNERRVFMDRSLHLAFLACDPLLDPLGEGRPAVLVVRDGGPGKAEALAELLLCESDPLA